MNPTRLLPGLALLALLGGCAVQDASSGYGDEEDTAPTADDAAIPTFDLPVDPPDVGLTEPDTGSVSVDPDVGSSAVDTGPFTQPDVGFSRDLGTVPTDRGTPTTGSCATQTSCASCTAQSTCGWCALTARCMDGSATGPVGGATCALGWAWTSSACTAVDPCNASTSCGACAAQAGCGWCGASNRCVTANTARSGPASGACASAWSGTVAACTAPPPDPCNGHTECGGCTDDSRCGWCRSTRRCQTGISTGPTLLPGSCTSWAYVNSQCTTPGDSCASSGSCGGCVGRSSCGWCDDSSTCHRGTSSGPTDGACARGNWTWSSLIPLFCL